MLFLVEKNKGGLKKMSMFKEKRKLIFSIFLISCIFISMSLVSANDNITLEDGSYKEDYQNKDFSINDDVLSIDKSDTDSTSNDSLNKSKSFSDLDNLINADLNKSEIILNDDYIYQDSDVNFIRGILINKSVVINGNGHTIDAQNKSKIFNIHADNVIIKNITFMNANGNQKVHDPNGGLNIDVTIPHSHPFYIDGRVELNGVVYNSNIFYDIYYQFIHSSFVGGAIYCEGNNLKIINSSFVNNFASCGGGIYIGGTNAQLINLLFINNTSEEGGAIFNSGKNTFISNSQFNLNYALYGGDSIYSGNDINIQNCIFPNNTKSVLFTNGNWQIDNMTRSYFDSFVKFGYINFKFNLTHIHGDYYNLKIKFGYHPYWMSEEYIGADIYGFSVNKKFCLNIDGVVYNLQTDSDSQASLYLNLSNGVHDIEVFNPISKCSLSKSFNVPDLNKLNKTYDDANTIIINKIQKVSPKVFAVNNKVFNKKTKIKKYTIVLKNKSKPIKNAWVTLKIKGKLFKAKTNKKGKATFKITKLNKKGKYNAKISFKGSKYYNSAVKYVKIIIK